MISVKHISKQFGVCEALKNISFEIPSGEIVGFLGQNGAGKTTLMRILTAYLPPSSGEAFICGENILSHPVGIRRKIGYLPENPPLYSTMTVKNYLRFAARLKDVSVKYEKAQVDHVLSECHLLEVKDHLIATLSKGYKQRVGIAQAIIHEPEVIILDEPTNGLDPVQIQHVRQLIRRLESKRTVIISTHILSEIEQLAQRVLILKKGEIVADNAIEQIVVSDEKKQLFVTVKGKEEMIEQAVKEANDVKQINIKFLEDDLFEVHLENTNNVSHYNQMIQSFLKYQVKIVSMREKKNSLEEAFLKIHK
ncbi:MAG TPA: ABC transporter ATP-binding protein [Candidatus Omnitrophota bacterium]|nr:ABC transporter ATP-binding protein [Candidatus Omnitrophota bacterium]